MNHFFEMLEDKVALPMSKISEQRHLRALRDGVVSAIPFIIVGSFFLIIAFPPVPENWAIHQWATDHITEILIPYRMTFLDYVSVYLFWNRIQFSEKLSVRSFDRSTIIGGSFSIKYYAGTVRSRIDVANGITRISGDFPVYGFSHFCG